MPCRSATRQEAMESQATADKKIVADELRSVNGKFEEVREAVTSLASAASASVAKAVTLEEALLKMAAAQAELMSSQTGLCGSVQELRHSVDTMRKDVTKAIHAGAQSSEEPKAKDARTA